jgi:YbbR domain-containing protein
MRVKWLTENITLKLFSLLVAGVMFAFVSWDSDTPVEVAFPIKYALANDIILIGNPPNELHATLQGPWATLRAADREQQSPVVIDLSDRGPGTLRYRVETTDIKPSVGLEVDTYWPLELELELDRLVTRTIPVEPDIAERPAFGYEILSVQIDPPRVDVEGPMKKMRTLDFVSTRPIDIGGREDDVRLEVDLRQPGPDLRLKQRQVTVLVEIGEEFVQRVFNEIRVGTEHAPRGTRVAPRTVSVTLKGPRRLVDSMKRSDVKVVVDVMPEAAEGETGFEKQIELRDAPERTQLVAPVPKVAVSVPRRQRR